MIGSAASAARHYLGSVSSYSESRGPRPAVPADGVAKKTDRPTGLKKELAPEEKQQVAALKQRDAQVRAHEMAHMAAAGSLAMGGPNYVFQTGPDGKNYAIGGDVKIDTSKGRAPEETIRKAEQIRAAALAPADPSPQDLRVAAAASSMAAEAQSKLNSGDDAARKGETDSWQSAEASSSINTSKRIFPTSETDPRNDGQSSEQKAASSPFAQRAITRYNAGQPAAKSLPSYA